MNINDLKKVLPALLKNDIVPFLWGHTGDGKTTTYIQVAKQLFGGGYRHIYFGPNDTGDIMGLPVKQPNGEHKYTRPTWFPTEGSGVIILDELNRIHPDVMQGIFSFIREKKLGEHVLPPGWKIVAAGNYETDEYGVTSTMFEQAWMARFCHIHFSPTMEEFCMYLEDRGRQELADFIRENPEHAHSKSRKVADLAVRPNHRAWDEFVGALESEDMSDEVRYEVYAGIVGEASAAAYMSWKKNNRDKLRLRDILSNYEKVRPLVKKLTEVQSESRFDALSGPFEELATKLQKDPAFLKPDQVKNLQAYMLDVPLELVAQTVKRLGRMQFSVKNELFNDKDFISKVAHEKKKTD